MWAEAMHRPIADTDKPGLGIRVTRQQTVGSREEVVCDLVGARVDIDSDDPAFVPGFDLRTDLTIIELVSTACELFFAIARLSYGHDDSPV
jgi:hypothetical protein